MVVFWPHCSMILSVSCKQQKECCPAKCSECSFMRGHLPLIKLWSWTGSVEAWLSTPATERLCCLHEARKVCINASMQTCNWNWQRRKKFPTQLSHQISSIITPDRESLFLGSWGFNFALCPAQAAQISKGVDFLYYRGGMHRSMRRRRDTRCLWMS